MSETSASVEVKDFVECLRDENKRLVRRLYFAKNCMDLLEEYRNCLQSFANHCQCDHNFDNQMIYNRLERRYQQMKDQDMNETGITNTCSSNVTFVRTEEVCRPCEELTAEDINVTKDDTQQRSDIALSDKFGDSVKNIEDNETYKLIYLKNNDTEEDISDGVLEFFKCGWFKCNQLFDSEASLSQHMKTNHFRVYEDNDHSLIFSEELQEMVIKHQPEVSDRPEPKSKTKRTAEDYVCQWVGCHRRFRSVSEMKSHKNSVHNRDSYDPRKMARFSGLKPLTIHTLDSVSNLDSSSGQLSSDKPFKCDLCDKTYSRKDSLKVHMSNEHNSRPIKKHLCDHCDYQTPNASHMNRHILRKHTNQRPYKCDLDNCHPGIKCFATMEQLRTHQSNVHQKQL